MKYLIYAAVTLFLAFGFSLDVFMQRTSKAYGWVKAKFTKGPSA